MGLLLAGTAITAQSLMVKTAGNGEVIKPSTPTITKATVVWSNDFSNASDWVMTNTSNPALDWSIETDPNAIPVLALKPAAFTTVSNGYAFINSDAAGQGATQNCDITIANPIDLSAVSSVGLRFQHSYRTFEDRRTVQVSNDNGATWTEFVITEGLNSEANQNTANPDILTLNISSVAANQAQVLIRFHYEASWGWYWAIDDIDIIELDPFDLKAIDTYGADIMTDFEYSMVPMSQVRPISFGMVIKNIGGDSLTGAGVNYDINDGSSSVETGSFGDTIIQSTMIDTLFGTSTFTPSSVGTYTITLTAKADSADADPSNNTMTRSIEVTNNIWALDYGTDEVQINQPGAVGVDSNGVFKIGNQFLSVGTDTIWSVEVGIGSNPASVGNDFFVEIRKFNTSISDWEVVATTPPHTVTNNDLGTLVNVDLNQSASLRGLPIAQGEQYVILAGHNGGSFTERVSFTRAGLVAEGTVLFTDDNDALTRFGNKQRAMRIRPNFDRASNSAGVNENASVLVAQNMPNPARENTVISYTLVNNTDVTLTITDAMGKVVKTITRNNQSKGTHVFNVNTSDLANGIYQYTVRGAGSSVTKSMVVAK